MRTPSRLDAIRIPMRPSPTAREGMFWRCQMGGQLVTRRQSCPVAPCAQPALGAPRRNIGADCQPQSPAIAGQATGDPSHQSER